ncbi:hypothetical protein FNU76_19255 [Chitinimonas arctica]|uniref:Uncharacterized protein n=1 Tax=Chitinimonas arctica TaxID=2594795 RepID=A0A516SJJ4_9NEIS|nr:hypothetical protein [Chitinimonas arctica]QDQ28316.1 hypothetical protein FNU76_19255 [Chitinimonas arctica]
MDNRDNLTKSLFNNEVGLVCDGSHMFEGHYIDTSLAAELTGAMDGSRIDLRITATAASFLISHPVLLSKTERILHFDNGRFWMENHGLSIKKEKRKCGLGIRIFARQALAAKALGARRIVMPVAGGIQGAEQLDSELVWIKFGFISTLPFDIRARIGFSAGEFSNVRTLQQLFALPSGAQWWAENGHPFRMEFDTADNSYSWSTLTAYLNRKNITLYEH